MQRRAVVLSLLMVAAAAGRAARAQGLPAPVDRIGVLLPKSGGTFDRVNAAMRSGVTESFERERAGLAVDLYEPDDTPEQIAAAYRGMIGRGTALTLGPMTRSGVAALVSMGEVPLTTLALNHPEAGQRLPWNVIVYSLSVESEARQVAREAGRRLSTANPPRARILIADSPVAQRAAAAFRDTWRDELGFFAEEMPLPSSEIYRFRRQAASLEADVWFLSMGLAQAAQVASILGRDRPIWGTSLMSAGRGAAEPLPAMNGVRVVDMPAVLNPELVRSLGYGAMPEGYSLEQQRIHAFGIDALRVARAMFSGSADFELDGLTGQLRYDGPRALVERSAALAEYVEGRLVAY